MSENPTVADWIASGDTTIAVYCTALHCDHRAVIQLDTLNPRMTRDDLGRRVRCAACGHRGGHVMLDMHAYYERLRARGWDCSPGSWGPAPGAKGDGAL